VALNIGELLSDPARRDGDRTVLIDLGASGSPRRELTARELDAMARRVAQALLARGIAPGSAIALLSENSAELVGAWFGVVYAGMVVLPVSVLSSAPELAHRFTHAGCAAVLFDPARHELASAAAELAARDQPRKQARVQAIQLEAAAHTELAGAVGLQLARTQPSDTAMLLYTSGTTATAKGAAISHASLLTHTLALATHSLKLSREDNVLGVLPLSHSYGCRMVMLASLFAGARMVLVPRFHALRTFQILRDEAITWAPVVPTVLAAWCRDAADAPRPEALRWVLSAGAPLADALALRAEERLGVSVRQGYGMTEATFTAINAPPDERALGSVGRPSWGVEVRIVDDSGREVAAGEEGEVLVAGHNVMTGYLHDEAATREALASGFMHSGDVGRIDADGRLWIVDRKKDLVIRGGHNVYPSEVEAALATHPAVHDVAVIGRPDPYYGEEVVAIVICKAGAEVSAQELVAHAAERIARNKLPREVAFVTELPIGTSGKVHKRTLRAWLNEGRLQLEVAT
jgi:long-chain acyl-CoA synthetase